MNESWNAYLADFAGVDDQLEDRVRLGSNKSTP